MSNPLPDSAFDSAIRAGTSQPIEEIEPIEPVEEIEPTEGDGDEIVTKRGVGAPKGNTHNLRHGRRSRNRHGLVLTKLREQDRRAYIDLLAMRKYLEGELERAGKLTGEASFRVHTVLRLEAGCRQMERDMREAKDLTAEQRRTLAESLIRWTCQRDGIVSKLLSGLGEGSGIDWNGVIAKMQQGESREGMGDSH